VRHKYDDDIQSKLQFVLAKGQIGDWFVLYQLSKNCNSYFYREFIRDLAKDLSIKPKTSRSSGTKQKLDKVAAVNEQNGHEALKSLAGQSDESDIESESESSLTLLMEKGKDGSKKPVKSKTGKKAPRKLGKGGKLGKMGMKAAML